MARALCRTTSDDAAEATEGAIAQGKSALFAVLSGFFAASGVHPGVLLSPTVLLVGGLGSGAYTFDGRARQPGVDEKRPRGFLVGEEIPAAAFAAAPGSIAALAVACAFHPTTSFLAAAQQGVKAARKCGATARGELLEKVAAHGARCLLEPGVKRAILSTFGAVEGGLVGGGDLIPRDGLSLAAHAEPDAFRPPFSEVSASALDERLGPERVIIAVDAQGLFAAMSYFEMPDLCTLSEYEVHFPALAVPVRRGVSRMSPGIPFATPHDLRLLCDSEGRIERVSARARGGASIELLRDHETKQIFSP